MNTDLLKISDETIEMIRSISLYRADGRKNMRFIVSDINFTKIKQEIETVYNLGYGFKLIARRLGLSYTQCRRLIMEHLKIETRKGLSVVTDALRKRRAEIATEIGNFREWPKSRPEMQKNNNRGIQGYYWNKAFSKYVWLRSSFEYIYAKWLDSKNIIWNSEVKYFTLEDGRKYLPDFFIYTDDKETIKFLVEIKSDYKIYNREKQEFFTELPIITVREIQLFLPSGSSYMKELRLWKKIRKKSLE